MMGGRGASRAGLSLSHYLAGNKKSRGLDEDSRGDTRAQGANGRLAQVRRQQRAFNSLFPECDQPGPEIGQVVQVGAVPEHRMSPGGRNFPGPGNDGLLAGVAPLQAVVPEFRQAEGINFRTTWSTRKRRAKAQAAANSPGTVWGPVKVMAVNPGPKACAAAANSRLESSPPENSRAARRWRRR